MPKTYFVLGSYYGNYAALQAILRDQSHDSYAILTHEQRGPGREVMGFAALYNRLIRCAFNDPVCERVWVLGDDILPVGRCLRDTEAVLTGDKTIGVVFPVEAWDEGEKINTTILPFENKHVSIEEAMATGPIDIEQIFAGFACACISRAAWEAVGYMDESLGLGYGEDLDFGLRCWKVGYRVVNYRRAWFWHKRGKTYNKLVEEGKFSAKAPIEASARVQEKWPFMWRDSAEEIMTRLRTWRQEALDCIKDARK